MGIGTSVFLLVLGAILTFAVHVAVDGINVHALGVILMLVGGIGVILSAFFWESWGSGWGGPGRTVYRRQRTVVDPVVPVRPAVHVAPAVPVAPAMPVAPVAPVGRAMVVDQAGVPVNAAGVPVAGQAVPVVEQPVFGQPVVGQPVVGQPVVGAPARVVRRPDVRRTSTVYEDNF
ncbi:MAG: hypothetical protein ACRDZ8_19710 [Acidimicrobiales bacterium]